MCRAGKVMALQQYLAAEWAREYPQPRLAKAAGCNLTYHCAFKICMGSSEPSLAAFNRYHSNQKSIMHKPR